jgi:hypothetical protein
MSMILRLQCLIASGFMLRCIIERIIVTATELHVIALHPQVRNQPSRQIEITLSHCNFSPHLNLDSLLGVNQRGPGDLH